MLAGRPLSALPSHLLAHTLSPGARSPTPSGRPTRCPHCVPRPSPVWPSLSLSLSLPSPLAPAQPPLPLSPTSQACSLLRRRALSVPPSGAPCLSAGWRPLRCLLGRSCFLGMSLLTSWPGSQPCYVPRGAPSGRQLGLTTCPSSWRAAPGAGFARLARGRTLGGTTPGLLSEGPTHSGPSRGPGPRGLRRRRTALPPASPSVQSCLQAWLMAAPAQRPVPAAPGLRGGPAAASALLQALVSTWGQPGSCPVSRSRPRTPAPSLLREGPGAGPGGGGAGRGASWGCSGTGCSGRFSRARLPEEVAPKETPRTRGKVWRAKK